MRFIISSIDVVARGTESAAMAPALSITSNIIDTNLLRILCSLQMLSDATWDESMIGRQSTWHITSLVNITHIKKRLVDPDQPANQALHISRQSMRVICLVWLLYLTI